MATDYTEDAATALEMITDAGQTLTLTRSVSTTDPLTDITTTATTTGTFAAVAFDYSTYDQTNRVELIGKKSKRLLCASSSFTVTPKVNDLVTYNGSTWTIAKADELKPATVSILWTLAIVQ